MDTLSSRYRIQSVSDLTGVSTATLRAWERRYGFPSPQRSTSAYRLYSDADVELVKRMRSMVDSGVAPNEAARALLAQAEAPPPSPAEDPYAAIVDRIVLAAEQIDLHTMQLEIRRALLIDSGAVAFERILEPALRRIGERWHEGTISVAGEHLASHLIASAALDLVRMTSLPPGARAVLLGCFAEEQHTLPLYGAALHFATLGYRPVLLGARTPPSAIARAVESLAPDLVGLSVTMEPRPPSAARELVDSYADACGTTPWFVGGAAAEALRGWIEARRGVAIAEPGIEALRRALGRILHEERPARRSEKRAGRTARR